MMTTVYLLWCVLFGSIPFLLHYAQGQILSRNKVVTMSSKFNDWDGSRAVDGNYRTDADNCQCCAATNKETNPWIKVDLGDTYAVTRILVYSRSDNYSDSQNITGLTIRIDGGRQFNPPTNKWYKYDTFLNYAFTTPVTTKTVNLSLSGERHFVICEVDVIYDKIISKNKTVVMDSQFQQWSGSRAVDGISMTIPNSCYCCAATNCSDTSWLHLNLGAQYVIYYVTIYGRTDGTYPGQSFEGMSITFDNQEIDKIPNATVSKNTTKFYEFRSETKAGVSNVTLRLSHKDDKCATQLVICELVIYGGCLYGTYGVNCRNKCGYCRGNETCHAENGVCNECADGYKETDMLCKDLCENGTYGHNCTKTCGYCREGESCNQKTGTCSQCEYGYLETDKLCNDLCPHGTHGHNCSLTCGQCRDNSSCNQTNGMCEECQDGYTETNMLCTELCENGMYGHNCTEACGYCREGKSCNQKTGKCTQCEYGYIQTDLLCKDLCPNGTHGYNCSDTCGQCRNSSSCNQTNGICEQCENGYTETNMLCTELCENGTYGHNCTETCGYCREGKGCNQKTGKCTQCEYGYIETDLLCNDLCPNGTHGYNCFDTCGQCRDNSSCNQTNGMCEQCENGYTETNLLCTELCPNGTYGHNCSKECGQCKNNTSCNQFNGLCEQCEDGYTETNLWCTEICPGGTFGRNCTQTCGYCRNNSPCNQTNGMCKMCEDGYTETNLWCTKLCPNGSYGHNCSGICGNCANKTTCRKDTGICEDCEDGFYLTDKCTDDCSNGTFGRNCTEACGNCLKGTCRKSNGLCDTCAEGFDSADLTCKTASVKAESKAESGSSGGVIAGSVCGVLVLCGVAIGMIVFLKRRRQQNKESDFNGTENELSSHSREPEGIRHSDPDASINNTEDGYVNVKRTLDIQLDNLWSYIYKHKGNDAETLKSEYIEFGERLLFPTDDAMKYRQRVRYKDMAPYDHTRVHLEVEDEDEWEFINASHIDGYDRSGKFIAAQGPMQVNVADFWRMIWQYNVSKIVMLTNPVEMASVKCIQYWSDEGEVTYEKLRIVLLHEETREDYVIRTFDIYKFQSPSKQVRQFHYRAWPDKDVPRSAWSLVDFWREVMKDDDRSSAPIVVHCSAGVGRTGTFIALDNLYNQAKQKGSVNPVEIVTNLRHQRQKMVQTKDQYVYLHDAVAEALLVGTHHIPEAKFNQYYGYIMQTDSSTKKPRLQQQYKLLLDGLKHYEPGGQTSYAASNAEIDEYKPKAQAKALPKNVSSVTNYDGKEVFILTTVRQEDTIDELWRLIDQMRMISVVTLADRNGSSGLMHSSKPGRYHPELVDEETELKYTVRTYTYKGHQTSKAGINNDDLKQYVLWLDKHGLPDKDSVLKVIQEVFKWQFKMSDSQPVLIQCSDPTRNGIMCVLLNEVDRMLNHNGRINILESVTLMKRKMPGFISTFEQYRYIHEVLQQLVMSKGDQDQTETADETDIYVNVKS